MVVVCFCSFFPICTRSIFANCNCNWQLWNWTEWGWYFTAGALSLDIFLKQKSTNDMSTFCTFELMIFWLDSEIASTSPGYDVKLLLLLLLFVCLLVCWRICE